MVAGVQILSNAASDAQREILTEDALKFLSALHRTFESTRQNLLRAREDRQRKWDAGAPLDFPPETAHIRAEPSWHCAPPAPGLEDRRTEITGPTDRKMVINALNSGAKTFMADFEGASPDVLIVDSCLTHRRFERADIRQHGERPAQPARRHSPPDRLRLERQGVQAEPEPGRPHRPVRRHEVNFPCVRLTLLCRPRGWHLDEPRVTVDGAPVSGSIFDFALYFFHNAKELVQRGTGPYFYLPKMEHYLEARLWNDIFNFSQSYVG